MGSALGATATLPVVWALGIFVFLGLGLSSPFLLLCIRPEILKWLPRPGAWMESFKELLAFPLFATVLWLLWVAALQVGSSAWLWACSVMLAVAFSFWLGRRSTKLVPVAWLIAICAFLWGAYQFKNSSPLTAQVSKDAEWTAYRKELLVEARQRSQGVFVDFTAAWCITCQVNKKVVLERGDVLDLFRKHNVLLLRADWTHQNPEITQALADFDRNSVPLYVYYAADGSAPRVLPQILAWSTIEELFTVDP
jgi:thiol:disulfide interchange protein DsbD